VILFSSKSRLCDVRQDEKLGKQFVAVLLLYLCEQNFFLKDILLRGPAPLPGMLTVCPITGYIDSVPYDGVCWQCVPHYGYVDTPLWGILAVCPITGYVDSLYALLYWAFVYWYCLNSWTIIRFFFLFCNTGSLTSYLVCFKCQAKCCTGFRAFMWLASTWY